MDAVVAEIGTNSFSLLYFDTSNLINKAFREVIVCKLYANEKRVIFHNINYVSIIYDVKRLNKSFSIS